jgi:murein DD-endopeptidase MepM/ murein hydrolase activator NlpD
MQILITHGSLAKARVLHFNRWQMVAAFVVLVLVLIVFSGTVYHVVFLKAAREGWPVVSTLVRLIVKDEFEQRDRFMRENLDAMARKVGEMQAKVIRLEAMGERVSELAGIKPSELPAPQTQAEPIKASGQGGPFVPAHGSGLEQLDHWANAVAGRADQSSDLFTLVESRLFEKKLGSLMVPNSRPVHGPVGSGFGFRTDPFSGRAALHTGLDFPAPEGTPIYSAAGGVVITSDYHPAYGQVVELDHNKGLMTRYAHTSRVFVKAGDIVKRGQLIAHVGSTGRSTGSHLHFEVLVDGVPQDPAKFLAGGESNSRPVTFAGKPSSAVRP